MENLILPSEIQIYFDWKDTPNANATLCVIPFYEESRSADSENIIRDGVKADRTAFPSPGGRIADNALTFVPSYPGNFKAMIKMQMGGLPSALSSLLFVFSVKDAAGDAVSVKQIGSIGVWSAIPSGKMDVYGTERLSEGVLSGAVLEDVHSIPIEVVREGGNWIFKSIVDGHEKYRSILEQCGFSSPKKKETPPPKPPPEKEKKAGEPRLPVKEPKSESSKLMPAKETKNADTTFTPLVKGQRIKINPSVKQVLATLEVDAAFTPDISAFILDGQTRPKATGEELIFYNQTVGANGAIQYDIKNNSLSYDLSKIPNGIEKIVVVVSADVHFGMAKRLAVKFISDKESYIFEPDIKGTSFTAIEMCEVYRKDGLWRFNAKGTGVSGGLAELCSQYGVETN